MNRNIKKTGLLLSASMLLLTSCKKFEEINKSPYAADASQVQVEYFINNSIIQAQQDPDVAERSFILYWKVAAHQQEGGRLSYGNYNDQWTTAYYNQVSGWLNSINTAIQVGEEQMENGTSKLYTSNLIQVARIWRAYLMSEMSDIFGSIPVDAFQGINPDFVDVKTVYYFMLDELKDATSKLDLSVTNPDEVKKEDPAYGYNYAYWQKYGNSMRLRLAMRLSEVDGSKAKAEFEDAAKLPLLTAADETFQVQEKPGWDALTGVMSREWNAQFLSPTLFNIYFGLGGVKSADQLPDSMHSAIQPANWMGQKYDQQFSSMSNDPSRGYFFNGLPYTIDPRAYKAFIIPGWFSNPNFCYYPSWTTDARNTVRNLLDDDGNVVKTINAKNTWNPTINGDWGKKGSKNQVIAYYEGTVARLSLQFRNSTSKRVFFAPWETYFLLAEASERGWATPMGGKEAYEAGITASFAYWGLTPGSYLSSSDYNRFGTSVNWDHTTEPAASVSMNYVDGYTGAAGTMNFTYPKNDLYKGGSVKNDHLTKIITQKYISQVPWLPLEAWSDRRRLGLPFFENPTIENPIPTLPALTSANYMTSSIKFFPQRVKYPSSLATSNEKGYGQAVSALGGPDEILTPLWWAQH